VPSERKVRSLMNEYQVIGKRLPRIDAKEKVRGQAHYTDDLKLPGMLCGMILRSPFAHARILKIDASRALKVPGVKAVVTGDDTLKVKYGVISRSPKLLTRSCIEYILFSILYTEVRSWELA